MTSSAFRHAYGWAPVAALLVVLTGCGTSQEYTVPESLCGRKVDRGLVKPLLPRGKRLTANRRLDKDWIQTCHISVDTSPALYISDARSVGDIDAMTFARQPQRQMRNPEKAELGDDGVLADDGAFIVNRCAYRGKTINYILEIQVSGPQTKGSDSLRPEILRFARSYLPTGFAAMHCGKP